jgi:predicted RNA binding protein YcfA (HicA-like mRNA interferase family)
VNFRRFIEILESNGFVWHRQGATSHRIYRRETTERVYLVTVACHRFNDDIKPGTLSAMIRQSGLDKKLFR